MHQLIIILIGAVTFIYSLRTLVVGINDRCIGVVCGLVLVACILVSVFIFAFGIIWPTEEIAVYLATRFSCG